MTSSNETIYRVVINNQGRYSIWPEYKEIPWGWQAEGKIGSRQNCLDHISQIWTDMHPLSLQKLVSKANHD
ncbi:MAG: MbtH family NRPS accessory protein [Cyanobacteria bacterium J06621_11]